MRIFFLIFVLTPLSFSYVLTRQGGGEFLPILGRRCSILAFEDGRFEVWFYPFKALSRGEIEFFKDGRKVSLGQIQREVLVSPFLSSLILNGEIKGRIDLLSSHDKSLCLFQFHIQKGTAEKILLEFTPSLQLMWPAPTEGEVKCREEAPNRLVFTRSSGGKELQLIIASDKPFRYTQGEMEIEIGDGEICLAMSGGVENLDEAKVLIDGYLGRYARLLEENEEAYRDFAEGTAELRTTEATLDSAFQWAKIGLDKCFVETELGNGFVAGYNSAGEGNRPGFAWFFGRDSAWMSFAGLCIGDFSKVKQNLILQRNFQIREGINKGKIHHELSLAHKFVPDPSYAYPAGDSTPLYVIVWAEYAKWSGDLAFLKENWESILEAMRWCERMDVDGDLLIDNPPAGHQWFDYGEKNMIDLVAIWQKALEEGAWIAGILGKEDLKARWSDKAKKVKDILNKDFWNGGRGYFYDRKLPDGSFLDLATCNPTVPMLWKQIDEEKAQKALTIISSSTFSTNWGIRTTAKGEKIYNPWGYHEGTVWPLVTGWASIAQFLNCRPEEGYKTLLSNARMYRDFCLGYIPEILNGDRYEAGGCPLQGWSEAMVILPVLKGMLGLEPDPLLREVKLTVHIPQDLDFLKVKNLRIGESRWDIEWSKGKEATLKLRKSGNGEYLLKLEISGMGFGDAKALVDGTEVKMSKVRKPCGYHFTISAPIREETIIILTGSVSNI